MGARQRRSIARQRRSLLALAAALLGLLCLSASAAAAPIAYPDLQVLVPTSDIAIGHPTSSTRSLDFSHITWNAGTGPFEIRPSYNPLTGISQGFQALYSSPSPGAYTFERTVPIAGPMIWDPPSDYRFPLDSFALYTVAGEGGGIGSLVATSPKVDFCITGDTYVGGVPNTPTKEAYPEGDCTSPTGTLGLSVGWGDQYESTDGGENIELASVPNGTYWLRAIVDPDGYIEESNTTNNITDTKLRIEGNSVTVLEQTHPGEAAPPAVTLTAPPAGSTASGKVTLSATASGAAPIAKVQFLLDGEPLGAAVTSPPYTYTWTVGSTTPGTHYLSAQATDANGLLGTAAAVPVNVPGQIGTIGTVAQASQTGKTTTTTPTFSTAAAGDVLLAFAGSDGPSSGGQTLTVSGAGLTWKLVKRSNAQAGDAEIWSATTIGPLSNASVTATAAKTGYDQSLTVVALSGALGIGNSAVAAAAGGAPTIGLTATQAGAVDFATGDDWDNDLSRTLGAGQTMLSQDLDTATGDTYWTQYAAAPTLAAGQSVTLNDTAPTADRWDLAAVEVIPGTLTPPPPDLEPPTVSIVNPVAGQMVTGTTQVSATATDNVAVASVQFYLDGKPLGAPVSSPPYAVSWDTSSATPGAHTLTAVATDTSGNVGEATPVKVTVENPPEEGPCFVMDAKVTVDGHGTLTTPTFTTAQAGEQLLAFVASDGPNGAGKQSATVSGAGLKWTLVKRANSRPGDAEIWWATATKQLSNVTVASKQSAAGYDQSLTVIAEQMSDGIGASATAGAASGAPSISLKTTEEGSLLFAVGEDWDRAAARTLGSNQMLLQEYLDKGTGDTFWSQYTALVTGAEGSTVTLNDTAPTNDQWNMAAVELLGDGPGN
jgi:hypothetical protein